MKKLLSILGSLSIAATASASVVSCGTTSDEFNQNEARELSNEIVSKLTSNELGDLEDLVPLISTNDGNIFNTDNSGTVIHNSFGIKDYSPADHKISTYEIAQVWFHNNGIDFNYDTLFGFKFILQKVADNSYSMKAIAANGKEATCTFSSKEDIQLSLNSVFDDSKILHLPDGNIRTLLDEVNKNKPVDFQGELDVINRANSNGIRTVDVDNNTGCGTIWLYDKKNIYSGYLKENIIIDNYEPLKFDSVGNSNKFYNDHRASQNEALNKIDKNFAKTELDPKKHVVVLGFDGLRYKEVNGDRYFKKLTAPKVIYGDYYNQAWESFYGWKTDLTGTISGSATNIFQMVNNSKNGSEMYAFGNFMWSAFRYSVFGRYGQSAASTISQSFRQGQFIDLTLDANKALWLKYAREEVQKPNGKFKNVKIPDNPGQIDHQEFSPSIYYPSQNDIMYSALKSQATFDLSMDMLKQHDANLTFHYDTEADDEGHAFYSRDIPDNEYDAFYQSKVLDKTLDVYADEYNQLANDHKDDPNWLILQVIDHGRDSVDADHEPWDPDPHRVFMIANKDIKKYANVDDDADINQSSIKEIIWNFLQKSN